MYLLDTNICIAINNNNPKASAKFYHHSIQCYISTVVLAELYKGAYCSRQIEGNLQRISNFLSLIQVVKFDEEAAIKFGIIQGELRQMGRPSSDLDVAIAAVARSRKDILVTDNIRHFIYIPNLPLENWLD